MFRRGQVVAGRYQVVDLIGRGGMGAIYRVHDRVLNEQVALKTLLPQLARNQTVVQRFFNEARIARQLSHPNIVRVHDIGMADGVLYISMEFVEGQSLRALMESRGDGRMDPRTLLGILDQICAALDYAHQHTVHRDIKPENIMVAANGAAKLMDFGISKLMAHTRMTMTSVVMGTPQYMSPEQFRDSGAVDARADIYSIGVLLYEALTGSLPSGMSRPVSTMTSQVPAAVDPIVARCLEVNPEHRFQSAAELRAALAEVRTALEGDAPAVAVEQATPARRRSRSAAVRAVGALLALALLAGAGFAARRVLEAGGADAEGVGETWEAAETGDGTTGTGAATGVSADVLEQARSVAEGLVAGSESADKQRVFAYGAMLEEQAATLAPQYAATARHRALQCYVGIIAWPEDDAMVFVPPGETALPETGMTYVHGFYMDRREVTNRAFLEFCARVPQGWPYPTSIAAGVGDGSEVAELPVTGLPFYYAQGYAVFYADAFPDRYAALFGAWGEPAGAQGLRLPSEAQWQHAAALAAEGSLEIEGLDAAPAEWTRSRYGPAPYGTASSREDPAGIGFGVSLVVRGGGAAPLTTRVAGDYALADPGIGFRCVKELPRSTEKLVQMAAP